jgi:hypothetical protein
MGKTSSALAFIAACLAVAVPGAASAQGATPVRALTDDLAFVDPRPEARALAFATARRAGARTVRITLDWSRVAPEGAVKPAGFDAANPADPAYRWGYIEDAVRDAAAARLRVVLVVARAPAWAGGPNPDELGAFVRAAARRFSGFYPDPKDAGNGLTAPGKSLPRVRYWQIWDAPAGGASHYRRMLVASARVLRRVAAANVVVSAPSGSLRFWRRLRKAPFDIAAHDLVGRRTIRRLGRLQRVVGRKPLWLTGIGLGTPPQNPNGVSPARQARFLALALYRADRARVRLVAWNGLQDRASYLAGFPSIASGLYFNIANDLGQDPAKPALRAYRFPFVVKGRKAWGVAPRHGRRVRVERRRRGKWRPVASAPTSRSGEFTVAVRRRGLYRARQAGELSRAWKR